VVEREQVEDSFVVGPAFARRKTVIRRPVRKIDTSSSSRKVPLSR